MVNKAAIEAAIASTFPAVGRLEIVSESGEVLKSVELPRDVPFGEVLGESVAISADDIDSVGHLRYATRAGEPIIDDLDTVVSPGDIVHLYGAPKVIDSEND